MTAQQKQGFDFAWGAAGAIAAIYLIYIAMTLAVALARNITGAGVDDSDGSAWHRSGLTVYTDAKTGVQYLSDGHGGLVKREKGDAP